MQTIASVYVGGGSATTNFSVDPPFNVNGTGVVGGGFGGVLFPVPHTTNTDVGFRVGAQGGRISGTTSTPAASPFFSYTVTSGPMFYEEAFIRFAGFTPSRPSSFFLTASVGIAESKASVTGVSGPFSVTDSSIRTGMTFTAGAGLPIATFANGTQVELFGQWRGTQWIANVSIPGGVPIGSFTNEIDGGLTFHFNAAPPPPAGAR